MSNPLGLPVTGTAHAGANGFRMSLFPLDNSAVWKHFAYHGDLGGSSSEPAIQNLVSGYPLTAMLTSGSPTFEDGYMQSEGAAGYINSGVKGAASMFTLSVIRPLGASFADTIRNATAIGTYGPDGVKVGDRGMCLRLDAGSNNSPSTVKVLGTMSVGTEETVSAYTTTMDDDWGDPDVWKMIYHRTVSGSGQYLRNLTNGGTKTGVNLTTIIPNAEQNLLIGGRPGAIDDVAFSHGCQVAFSASGWGTPTDGAIDAIAAKVVSKLAKVGVTCALA